MREIQFIVLHCTATDQNFQIEEIQNFWKNKLKWKEPGYHFIIEKSGRTRCLQSINKLANGVRGYNSGSIHISYVGGVDENGDPVDNRTAEQKSAQFEILTILNKKFPDAEILGHKDFPNVEKDCPSFDVKEWLAGSGFYDLQ